MSTRQPNVLFIMTDQQRWDCVGANGNPLIRTPALDSLAYDGASFSNSFASAMACVPSRACIMSGQYVHTHGVGYTSRQRWLPPETPTLPGCFSEHGYYAMGVGKMHFTPWYTLSGFDRRVFIESKYDGTNGGDEYRRTLAELGLSGKNIGHHTPGFGKAFKTMPTTELPPTCISTGIPAGAEWRRWNICCAMSNRSSSPSPFAARTNRMIHRRLTIRCTIRRRCRIGRFRDGELAFLPPEIRHDITDMGIEHLNLTTVSEEKKRQATAYYYGNISLIDHWIGQLLETLQAHDQYDDTIILFTSDHGEYLGDHGLYYKGYFPCDADSKVPLLLKAPGIAGGAQPDAFACNSDIMPTLLSAAGLPVPNSCQGISLLPAARGEAEHTRDGVVTYSECGPCYRLRTREWAYVCRREPGCDQLYHLPDDPHELTNLAAKVDFAPVVSELRKQLVSWFIEHPSPDRSGVAGALDAG